MTDIDPDDESGPTAGGPTLPAELLDPTSGPVGPNDEDDAPFDLGELLGGGGLDLGNLMQQAAQMQEQMAAAQQAAAETIVEGVAGGGAVTIAVTGTGHFQSVTIDPSAVDPDDVEMLQDLVLAALHAATERIQEVQSQGMGGFGDLLGGA